MNISGGKLVAIRAGNIEQQKDGTRNKPKRSPSFSRHEKNSLFVIVQDAPTNTTQRIHRRRNWKASTNGIIIKKKRKGKERKKPEKRERERTRKYTLSRTSIENRTDVPHSKTSNEKSKEAL